MKIYTLIAILAVAQILCFGYNLYEIRRHQTVIDTQGQVIFLLLETPAIRAALNEEIKRRQGLENTEK